MKKATLIVSCLFAINSLFAQKQKNNPESTVIHCSEFHITRPLSEIFAEHPVDMSKIHQEEESKDREHNKPQRFKKTVDKDGPAYGNDPSTLQSSMGTTPGRAPIQNWAGQTASGFYPLDPSGAAGPNNYIQMINATTFKVFNKSTGAAQLTGTFGNLWTTATPNDGDPIVLYDKAADRWFMSQFGQTGNKIYIAISTTNNPLGSWYTYTFTSPLFPDYLKFSVWQDGYYMTSNQSTQRVFAFERTQMLLGNASSRAVTTTFSPPNAGYFFVPLPGDTGDGTLAAAGTPCPIFSYSDSGWGAGYSDAVNINQATVNWVPSTPTMSISATTSVPAAAFDGSYNSSWNDVPQPNGQKLDGIGGTLMFRAQYKIWGGYNSVVLSWGVKISATQRSIKWCELRQTAGVWAMYQEGIYTPDANTRWMSSIAMDNNGSIALCYMKSNSSNIYPGLYYTGRRSCDPLGTLPITEATAQAGAGSQAGINRDGDYAETWLDPDGITFWHTGMYMDAGGNEQTRVYSFQIAGCSTQAGVAISQTTGTNPECAGASATFTATPTNGGTTPTYQWQVNGVNVGGNTTTPTFTTTTLTNGQIVTCIMTSNLAGVTGNPATSNAITMVVNPVLVPAVSIALTTGTNPECAGASATFTATPTNGGTPTYQWKVNGVNSGTGVTFTTTTLTTGQIVTCVMTSTATCANPTTATSNAITMTVNPTVVPAVSIALTTGTNPECAGASATFTATPTNGGTPTYQWKVNGVNSGTGVTFTTTTLTTGQIVTCVMTSTANCASPTTATSNAITMTVNPTVVPAVSIALTTGTNPECVGASATFTATPTNGGTPTYQWKVNGVNAGTNSATFTTTTLTNGQIVTCVMTSNANCASPATATSNAITMVVNSNVAPTVSIAETTGTNPSCAGSSVTFTATPTNGGTSPTYQWKVNGVNVATGVTYTTTTLTTGQIVTCVMTSNSPCVSTSTATSNAITMTVTATVTPSVAIAQTAGTNPECAGASATFTATATNGGATPIYQWQVNGANAGTNSATFTTTTLTTGQVITCVMTSVAACPNPTTATSNSITMVVNPTVTPSVLITQTAGTNPECAGASATFTATPTNGGTTPTYQWKVNGVNVATGVSFTTTTLTNGQIVTCIITSNVACASATTATSNAITMVITASATPSVAIALTSGTNPECAGSTTTFTATATNGGTTPTYQWFINGTNAATGVTFTSTTLANSDVVTCIMTSNAICTTSPTATSNAITMIVNVSPATPTASSNSPVCEGATITLTTATVAGATYTWTGPNSYTSASQNPTIASSTNANAGTYSLTETVSGCTSAAGTVTVVVNPLPVITNSTLTQSICSGTNASFNPTSTIAGTSFTWTATSPGNITGFSAIGSGSIGDVLTNTSSTASTVSYVITPVGPVPSQCAGTSVTFVVTVNPAPTVVVNSTTICSGQTTTLTANGATTYAWSAGATVTGVNTATVNPLTTATYTVTGTAAGCFNTAIATVTVNQLPVVGVNSPTICIGQAATLTASGASTYTWSAGATSTGVNTATASPITNTTYTVTGTSAAGCVNTAFALVTVDALPATPSITQNGAVLSSSALTGNQWYLNGVLIPGATNQFYTTTQNGVYTVVVTTGGCTSSSSEGTVINTGIAEIINNFSFDIYPNPNDGTFVVNINSTVSTTYIIEIHNTLGQIIYKQSLKQFTGINSYPVDISAYSKGIYMISVIDGNNESVKKVIVY